MSMYEVRTDIFQGPLDLLLHLIEKDDLDITAVSLVQVTDQYLAALRMDDSLDLRALADFIAVGAKLLFLKSRALLPRSPDQEVEDEREVEEIVQDLTAQLEEYRKFKAAAAFLRDLDDRSHRSFVRVVPPPADWLPTGLEKVTLTKLMKTLVDALNRLPPEPEPERLQRYVLNIGERRETIMSTMRRRGALVFTSLLAECRSRLEAIVTFLAVLDLLKTEDLQAEQSATFGDIVLTTPQARAPTVATAG